MNSPKIYVSFSAGADSTALLLLSHKFKKDLTAVHFNHNLRAEESDEDEAFCRSFCHKHNIKLIVHNLILTPNKPGESIEMQGRLLRQDFWQNESKKNSDFIVLLGHHLDDCLETLLFRLGRGANASGLSHAIKPDIEINGVRYQRPLLAFTKNTLEKMLLDLEENFRFDSSNNSNKYKRNRIRNELIPLMKSIYENEKGLYHSLQYLSEDASYLEELANEISITPLTCDALRNCHKALWPRIIQNWIFANTKEIILTGTDLINRIDSALTLSKSCLIDLNADYQIEIKQNIFHLNKRDKTFLSEEIIWEWDRDKRIYLPELGLQCDITETVFDGQFSNHSEYFIKDKLPSKLVIRQRKNGDRMTPFGSSSSKKLKDLISEKKLTLEQKSKLILICLEDDEIIWIPGVRRSNYAICHKGKNCIKISVRSKTKP